MSKNDEKNQKKMPFEAQITVFDEFLSTLSTEKEEKFGLLNRLLARIIVSEAIIGLWRSYSRLETDDTTADMSQLKLLFHSVDPTVEVCADIKEILLLMMTGKRDGIMPTEGGPNNIFPTGFWQLPEVLKEITRQTIVIVNDLLGCVCAQHYELPADWEDKEHPEGLYISLDDQVKTLANSVIDMFREFETAMDASPADTEDKAPIAPGDTEPVGSANEPDASAVDGQDSDA